MDHKLEASQDNTFLELGKLLSEEAYKRERREVEVGNMKLDLLKSEDKHIVIGEVKKSSRFLKAAEMQLLFYLYQLKEQGIQATGELLIPKEKKRLKVELTPEREKEVKDTIIKIQEIITLDKPPAPVKCRFCSPCAYREFCWA